MGTGREEGARGRGQIGALHWQMKEIGVYPQEVVHPKIPRVVSLGSRGHVRKRGPSGWSQVILKTGIIVSYPEIRWAVVGGAEGTQMGNKVEGGVKIVRCLTDGGGGGGGKSNSLVLGAGDDQVGVVVPVAGTGSAVRLEEAW